MSEKIVELKNKISYNLGVGLGSLGFVAAGIAMLFGAMTPRESEGFFDWLLGPFFLIFGVMGILVLLDDLSVTIYKDRLEIKSLFRKRIFYKNEILKYGIEDYETENFSGTRIRIFTKNESAKFYTPQIESIEEIVKFVKGKEKIKTGFRKEMLVNAIAVIGISLMIISPWLGQQYFASNPTSEVVDAVGIPATIGKEMRILKEENGYLIFYLKEYPQCIFKVASTNAPANLQEVKKELIVTITDPVYFRKFYNKEVKNNASRTMINVEEIFILEENRDTN